jgi:hypothetical protein
MLYELVRKATVKVGYGGAGFTLVVAVTRQPNGSDAVTLTMIGEVPVGI